MLALPQLRAKTVLWRACSLTVISCILVPSSPPSFWCLWSILFIFLLTRYIFFLFTHSLFFTCIFSPVSWVGLQVVTFTLLCDKQDDFVSNLISQRQKKYVGLKKATGSSKVSILGFPLYPSVCSLWGGVPFRLSAVGISYAFRRYQWSERTLL